MQQQQTQAQNFLKQMRENWFLIAFICSIIVGWTNFSNRLARAEENQTELKKTVETLSKNTLEVQMAIIDIKANYIFIKEALTKR